MTVMEYAILLLSGSESNPWLKHESLVAPATHQVGEYAMSFAQKLCAL